MISLSELVYLGKLYSPGSISNPNYAFVGGTAVQSWLHEYNGVDREHGDIDLFAFNDEFLKLVMGDSFRLPAFYRGQLTPNGIIPFSQATVTHYCDIISVGYFDAENTPSVDDVRCIRLEGFPVLVLSPEFIVVSKLSYPNIHRPQDFQDVLALNQAGCLQNPDYLAALLAKTALGQLIDIQDILGLRTDNDLEGLVENIHRHLIRRFIYWDRVNVDALNQNQFFVLLDVDEQSFDVPIKILQFIDDRLIRVNLEGRRLQIAKLGLLFITAGIPKQSLSILQDDVFHTLIHQRLSANHPANWLARAKNIWMIFQVLRNLEKTIKDCEDWLGQPANVIKIIQHILVDDFNRFTLLTSVQAVYHDFQMNKISSSDCIPILDSIM